jgi:hypothetical protein
MTNIQLPEDEANVPGPRRLCSCTLFANVNIFGELEGGFRAVSAKRVALGGYEVLFAQDIGKIGESALMVSPAFDNPGIMSATIGCPVGQSAPCNKVRVDTYDFNGNRQDRAFHLAVICPAGLPDLPPTSPSKL